MATRKKPKVYDNSMFIRTEEIAAALKVPWKASNQVAAVLKAFSIRKVSTHHHEGATHNLYNREQVERALSHLVNFHQGK